MLFPGQNSTEYRAGYKFPCPAAHRLGRYVPSVLRRQDPVVSGSFLQACLVFAFKCQEAEATELIWAMSQRTTLRSSVITEMRRGSHSQVSPSEEWILFIVSPCCINPSQVFLPPLKTDPTFLLKALENFSAISSLKLGQGKSRTITTTTKLFSLGLLWKSVSSLVQWRWGDISCQPRHHILHLVGLLWTYAFLCGVEGDGGAKSFCKWSVRINSSVWMLGWCFKARTNVCSQETQF